MFRSVIFLPQTLTPAVTAVVWKRIYAPDGPINDVLRVVGLGQLASGWLGDYTWALPALGIVGTWGAFGLCMVMFIAGMQSIPTELYDAARVDGAGPIREFFTVTLPGLRGPLAVVLTLTVLGAIRVFDIVWLTTRGGPGTSTITPTIVLYQRAFANPDIGAAAAIGVVLAVSVADRDPGRSSSSPTARPMISTTREALATTSARRSSRSGVLFPLVWVVCSALSPNATGTLDLGHLSWSNFVTAWTQAGFSQYLKSSLIITGSVVVVSTVFAIMSGYAFGVLGVFGQRLLFPIVLLGTHAADGGVHRPALLRLPVLRDHRHLPAESSSPTSAWA